MTPPNTWRLPEAFASVPDPCGANPFSEGNPRHAVWRDATRVAEEEICRAGAALSGATLETLLDLHVSLPIAQFDAWAKRCISVVWRETDLPGFEKWLLTYANGAIEIAVSQFLTAPPDFPTKTLLNQLRLGLAGRVQHWKAEARRYLSAQAAHLRALGLLPAVDANLKKWRKRTVKEHRRVHDLSSIDFAGSLRLDETAVRGIINEDRARFSDASQKRLLKALGISREKWYGS